MQRIGYTVHGIKTQLFDVIVDEVLVFIVCDNELVLVLVVKTSCNKTKTSSLEIKTNSLPRPANET